MSAFLKSGGCRKYNGEKPRDEKMRKGTNDSSRKGKTTSGDEGGKKKMINEEKSCQGGRHGISPGGGGSSLKPRKALGEVMKDGILGEKKERKKENAGDISTPEGTSLIVIGSAKSK